MSINTRAFCSILLVFSLTVPQASFAASAQQGVKSVPGESGIDRKIAAEKAKFKKTAPPLDQKFAKKQLEKFPRWRKNKKYRKAMVSEEKIWIVAKTRDSSHPKIKEELAIAGAGMTTAEKNHAFKVLNDFAGWTSLGEYVKDVHYDPKKRELFVHLSAYGYFAKMFMDVSTEESEEYSDLYMKVTRGHFLGMTVGFRIQKDAKSRKSEILMTAVHPFETLPLPQSFIEFGLEVVFQRLGQKLRQRMQSEVIASVE